MVRTKSKTAPYLGENLSQIKKLGLQNNINDLEIDGFTVIPPKKVASTQFLNKIRKTTVGVARKNISGKCGYYYFGFVDTNSCNQSWI